MGWQDLLVEWARDRRAQLPWRATRAPWAVLVSEVMLQQTQAPRVVPRYREFMDAFPTPAACAMASRADIIRLWGDLGFARRAVNLHAAAVAIVERHDGGVPRDLAALRALPGVGGYTARAVLAFAWGDAAAPVDTNIGRVLARAVAGERLAPSAAQSLADGLVPPGRSRDWSLALMDLGAEVCRKRTPRCGGCPLLASCAWAGAGWPEPDPARGSAGVSRPQSRFDGSDRQGRGRLLAALRIGPLPIADAAARAGWEGEPERVERVVQDLIRDGLVLASDRDLRLAD